MSDYAELRALAKDVERYDDGAAIHTTGDETCVEDCAACAYECAAGIALPGLLDKLKRYEEALRVIRICNAPGQPNEVACPVCFRVVDAALNPTEDNDG